MRLFGLIFSIAAVFLLTAGSAMAERRLALVVGNSNYRNTPRLENPKNDARAMATALTRLGFEVIRGIDQSSADMRRTVRKFAGALQSADVALFYYAGHGLQVKGENYLVPIDAKMKSTLDLEFEATNLQVVIDLMEREAKTNIVFLDACRDNPLARTLARSLGASRSSTIGQGLARIDSGVGTLIAYSTEPGNVALDGDGKHSPFTAALLGHIETPGLEVGRMLRRVRSSVLKQTRGKQVPWDHSSLVGDFYFSSPKKIAAVAPPPQRKPASPAFDPRQIELEIWRSIKQSRNPGDFENYLAQFPKGIFAPWAQSRLTELKREPQLAKRPALKKANPAAPDRKTTELPARPIRPPKKAAPVVNAKSAAATTARWQDKINALKEEGPHGDCSVELFDTRDRDPASWAECEERTLRIADLERRMKQDVAELGVQSSKRAIVPKDIDFARDRQRILGAIKSFYEAEGSYYDRPDTSTGGIIHSVEMFEATRRTATEIEVRVKFQMSPHDFGDSESDHDNRFLLERQRDGYRVLKMWSAALGWVPRRSR